ncbi:Permease component of an ABC superfamily L-carnitine/choline transporter [Lactobacillus helsingborgensis]|uniref:ABC transporter permease n=1 Tax=Lactobacillus helsingborgensis TaxID=1218494 RepID=A0A0F4M389_9LACO|nr:MULTISPECIES: ABC transporter permease [Lactobacillus]AIS08923.1 Osmotically activated L-carnitine/choline ABC transporter, permease protein OpuCB [Lactobacillus sp. wkB8]AWN33193.1 ABC transporter permease [Lactobacillus helsingborgensis]KJY65472.1 Permease component of an ABC superfamily L-carnitine/choline transporter [Lactobacillus helsingborgensis]MBC6356354.1 ABC transporter permease [Lactobacillus helsingborgensis]MBI0110579.1 ABC transporter permease [Lactobacillus sp. W8093]
MSAFFVQHGSELLVKTWQQIYISAISLALGIIVAIPLSIILMKFPRVAKIVIAIASMLQTIPALALLAMMIPFFGVGRLPAIIALFLYSLMPILRNTYVGLTGVNQDTIDSARGLGMTNMQLILKVDIPLAMPVIMAGIRLSAIYVIAWATLASYIGAGGLGDFIFNGLSLYQTDLIFGGTIPVIILALLTDYLLGKLERKLTPKGI